MKKFLLSMLIFLGGSLVALAQWSTVELDSLKEGGRFIDNNLLPHTVGSTSNVSYPSVQIQEKTDEDNGLRFMAIQQSDSVHNNVGASGYWNSIDYIFPEAIDRSGGDTLKVEWDMMFDGAYGSGESGRTTIVLLKDLPAGGVPDEDPANFGLPCYYIWIFNGSFGQNMSYGGSYNENPGWISGAADIYYNINADGSGPAELPNTDNWPLVPYTKVYDQPYFSTSSWKHYTWVLAKEMQHLYWRDSKDGPEADVEINFMALPENTSDLSYINEVHGTVATQMPPGYDWFSEVNALRFWGRSAARSGPNYSYISNIRITKTGVPVNTYAEFTKSQDRPKEDVGTYNLVLAGTNIVAEDPTQVVVEPLSGNFSHIADWPGDTLVFTDDGAEAAQIPIVNTTMEVNDTILIGITSISGGKFPAIGLKREFNLIIRPAEGSGTGITSDYFVRELKLSPNPAGHYIRIETRTGTAFDRLRVFDLSGQMLMDRPYLQEKEVEISGLGSGMYLMHLDGPAGRYVGKFIKR